MRLAMNRELPNVRLLWTDGDDFLVACGLSFWRMDKMCRQVGHAIVLGNPIERLLSHYRLTRQLLRLGIHHLWPLPNDQFLVVLRKRAFRVDARSGKAELIFRFPRGNKPAHRGVCVTENGKIILGEYVVNMHRNHAIAVYRSCDGGQTFNISYGFDPGEVRHVHFVQWDPFAKCLWMGTGDADSECRLYRSLDEGGTWELVGGGAQFWRAIGLAFGPDALYWGTDAGSDAGDHPNFVMRYDRESHKLDQLQEIQGPCHGIGRLKNGTILISTGVEGGKNEKDDRAHVWASENEHSWQELGSYKKDFFPFVLQFGVIRFPPGIEHCQNPAYTAMGLSGAGEVGVLCSID